jgi:hypothetical protein
MTADRSLPGLRAAVSRLPLPDGRQRSTRPPSRLSELVHSRRLARLNRDASLHTKGSVTLPHARDTTNSVRDVECAPPTGSLGQNSLCLSSSHIQDASRVSGVVPRLKGKVPGSNPGRRASDGSSLVRAPLLPTKGDASMRPLDPVGPPGLGSGTGASENRQGAARSCLYPLSVVETPQRSRVPRCRPARG